jgi:triosephosphate isomerase
VAALVTQPNVDGALVGGASNDVQGFFAIVSQTRAATV